MRRLKRPVLPANWMLSALLILGGLFFCLLTGLMAAVVPPGTLVRLLAIPFALMGVVLLWLMPRRDTAPERALTLLLFGLVVLINLWPHYVVYRFGGMPTVNPTKLAWLAFLGFAGVSLLSSKPPMARLVARCKAHPVLIFATLFLASWRLISAATGEQPVGQVLQMGPEIVSCYVLFFLVLAVLRDERDVHRLLLLLVGVALVQVLLASYESVAKHTLFDRFISVGAEDVATLNDVLREKFRDGHYRAQGTFEHPMVLAEFMAMMVPLASALFLTARQRWLRWAGAGFVPLAIAMILASRSRSGVAVLLVAVLLVGLLLLLPRDRPGQKGQSAAALVVMALLLPAALVAIYFGMQEFSSLVVGRSHTEINSSMSRVVMLERGIPLLQSSPLFGYGYGMGAVKLGMFDGVRYNIDNFWLGVALDSGIPGLIAFLTVFVGGALLGAAVYRRRADRAGTAAGMIAVSLLMLLVTKTVLSISSGFSLAYILIVAIIVLDEGAAPAPAGART
jgi:hypothetical protein